MSLHHRILKKIACFRSKRRLLFSQNYFSSWFGFNMGMFYDHLNRKGLRCRGIDETTCTENVRCPLNDRELAEISLYATCIDAEMTPAELAEASNGEELRTRWCNRTRTLAGAIAGQFERYSPTEVAIVQGYEPINACTRLIGLKHGLQVVAFENTALKRKIIWDDHSAITTNKSMASSFFWRNLELTCPKQSKEYCELLISKTKGEKTLEHTSPHKQFSPKEPGKAIVLFIGQVYTDSSVVFGMDGWKSPVEIIGKLMELALKMNFTLVVKLHPKESFGTALVTGRPYDKLTFRKLQADEQVKALLEFSDDIIVDHENIYDTYALIDVSDAVVTINSQAGLESVMRGKPVIICGRAFYGDLGFTRPAYEKHLLEPQLNRVLGLSAEEKGLETDLAGRFTHIYFERYCIEKSEKSVASCIIDRL